MGSVLCSDVRTSLPIGYTGLSSWAGVALLLISETAENGKIPVWGRTGFDVSGQRLVRRAEFAGDSLNAGT